MVRFGSDGKDGKARLAQWLAFVGVATLGVVAVGICAWKAFGAEAPSTQMPEDEARIRKMMSDKRTASDEAATRLKQQGLGESVKIDEAGRFLGVTADGAGLPKNRSIQEAAGGAGGAAVAQPPNPELEAVSREISMTETRPDAARLRGQEPRRPREGADGGDAGPRENSGARETSRLGYSINQRATWAVRRPGNAGQGGEPSERPKDKEDPMLAVLDGAVKAQERVLAGAARAAAPPGARGQLAPALAGGGGGDWAGGPSGAGESLYGDEPAPPGPARAEAQLFRTGEIGDMRLTEGNVPSQVVRQGKFLDCVLVNRLRADLVESQVIAKVVRDFVSVQGDVVLVPAGATLLGVAGRVQNVQQARVYIRFDRVVYPDQRSVYFPRKVPAVDALGSAGIEGDVDRHFFLQFGSAVVLGVLDGLAAAVQGVGMGAEPSVRDMIMGRTSSNLAQVMAGIIGRYGNVVPTITVEPGEKLKVFFADDVELTPYRPATGVALEERRRSERRSANAQPLAPRGLRR